MYSLILTIVILGTHSSIAVVDKFDTASICENAKTEWLNSTKSEVSRYSGIASGPAISAICVKTIN